LIKAPRALVLPTANVREPHFLQIRIIPQVRRLETGYEQKTGDSAAITDESDIRIKATAHAEILLFDMI